MSFLWRKRWFLILLPLLMAATAWQIRVESDLNAFFTATDSEDAKLLAGLLQSGELSRRYLLVVEKAGGQKTNGLPTGRIAVSAFSAKLAGQLAKLENVEQVWPANEPPREWIDAIRSYAPHHARLFSLTPREEGRELFDPNRLTGRAEGLKQALLSPQGSFVKSIAKQDPLLLSLNGFKDLQGQFERQAQRDRDGGALILQSKPAALDSEAQAHLQAARSVPVSTP